MNCRACESCDLAPLWADGDGYQWHRCRACGSDTSEAKYTLDGYGVEYATYLQSITTLADAEHSVHLFEEFATLPRRLALDVGAGHGAGRQALWSAGWETMGFDVSFAGRMPVGHVVAPAFRANLFWQRFDAVLCHEVLEHVPDGPGLLRELFAVTVPGGLCQITTPRPLEAFCPDSMHQGRAYQGYQAVHLTLWEPAFLRARLEEIGFSVVYENIWELGQVYVCLRPLL